MLLLSFPNAIFQAAETKIPLVTTLLNTPVQSVAIKYNSSAVNSTLTKFKYSVFIDIVRNM